MHNYLFILQSVLCSMCVSLCFVFFFPFILPILEFISIIWRNSSWRKINLFKIYCANSLNGSKTIQILFPFDFFTHKTKLIKNIILFTHAFLLRPWVLLNAEAQTKLIKKQKTIIFLQNKNKNERTFPSETWKPRHRTSRS